MENNIKKTAATESTHVAKNQQVEIEKSYLSVWPWLFILLLPALVRYIKINTRSYTYDSKNLHVEEGVMNKDMISIPLYKIETITVRRNLLGNGSLRINASVTGARSSSSLLSLEYIKNAKAQRDALWLAVEEAKEAKGVRVVDTY